MSSGWPPRRRRPARTACLPAACRRPGPPAAAAALSSIERIASRISASASERICDTRDSVTPSSCGDVGHGALLDRSSTRRRGAAARAARRSRRAGDPAARGRARSTRGWRPGAVSRSAPSPGQGLQAHGRGAANVGGDVVHLGDRHAHGGRRSRPASAAGRPRRARCSPCPSRGLWPARSGWPSPSSAARRRARRGCGSRRSGRRRRPGAGSKLLALVTSASMPAETSSSRRTCEGIRPSRSRTRWWTRGRWRRMSSSVDLQASVGGVGFQCRVAQSSGRAGRALSSVNVWPSVRGSADRGSGELPSRRGRATLSVRPGPRRRRLTGSPDQIAVSATASTGLAPV